LLIRPLIQANRDRQHKMHVFIFFIFLVCNIGGSLTPLGNPPIFLGFLKGVDFLWTLESMMRPMLLVSSILILLFYVIDRLAWNREPAEAKGDKSVPRQLRIEGVHNVLYLAGLIVGIAIITKLIGCGIPSMIFLKDRSKAMKVGIGMISRGEVGLIIAGVGVSSGVLASDIYTSIIIMVAATTIITPIWLKMVYKKEEQATN